jgi:hypothetical protein
MTWDWSSAAHVQQIGKHISHSGENVEIDDLGIVLRREGDRPQQLVGPTAVTATAGMPRNREDGVVTFEPRLGGLQPDTVLDEHGRGGVKLRLPGDHRDRGVAADDADAVEVDAWSEHPRGRQVR